MVWNELCFPQIEGGLGFRSRFDIAKALYAKFWWRYRTSTTLWSTFLWNKYCKTYHPVVVEGKGASHA